MVPKKWQKKTGKPRKFWRDTATDDLQNMEMTWTDYGEIADDRALWKTCVANVFQVLEHVEVLSYKLS